MKKSMNKTVFFIGLTFTLNWIMAFLFFYLGGSRNNPYFALFGAMYMFVPMLVGIFIQKYIKKSDIKEPLCISFKVNKWFIAAWLFPPVAVLASLGVSILIPGIEYTSDIDKVLERFTDYLTKEQIAEMHAQAQAIPIWIGFIMAMFAGLTINAIAGFGEELGWRGFLQKELAFLGFWKSSFLIGIIWGIWHAPIIYQGHNYPDHPLLGILMMTVLTTLLAPIFAYFCLKAKSVIAASICHGTLNATAGFSIILTQGGNDLIVGITGIAGFMILAIANLFIYVFDPNIKGNPITERD